MARQQRETEVLDETIAQQPPLDDVSEREPKVVEVVDRLRMGEVEWEAFMNENVTVLVHDSTDENAVPFAEVSVNGRGVIIPRGGNGTNMGVDRNTGRPVPILRCHVERLALARKTAYRQNLDPKLGEGINRLERRSSLDYPFNVIGDTPRGQKWLRDLMAQPT